MPRSDQGIPTMVTFCVHKLLVTRGFIYYYSKNAPGMAAAAYASNILFQKVMLSWMALLGHPIWLQLVVEAGVMVEHFSVE